MFGTLEALYQDYGDPVKMYVMSGRLTQRTAVGPSIMQNSRILPNLTRIIHEGCEKGTFRPEIV
jgi:hypothetical protein